MLKPARFQILNLLAAGSLFLTGCGSSYTYRPSIRDRAVQRAGHDPKLDYNSPENRDVPYIVTDKDVYDFENELKMIFRKKAVHARTWREISSTAQVLTAAAAATLLAVDGGATEVAAVLAGGSAVIPNLQKIFSAGERAQSYIDAVGLLEDAEARFLKASANDGGAISADRLTIAGAHFAEEIAATVRVMESSIAARIPKIDDVEKAHGFRLNTLKVSSDSVQFQPGAAGAATLSLIGGETVASADTSNEDVVTVTKSGSTVTLTPHHAGIAKVTVFGQSGASAEIVVNNPLQLQAGAAVLGDNAEVSIPAGGQITVAAGNSPSLSVLSADASKVQLAITGNTVTIRRTANASGTSSISLLNENGAKRLLTVKFP